MYEMVAADGEAVAVARHLPHCEVRTGGLESCGDGGRTTMDGVHAVGVHVIREARRATDA